MVDEGPSGMAVNGVIQSNYDKIVDNFDDMNLKELLLRGIYAYGFEKPSAIQQRAIMPCIEGNLIYFYNKYTIIKYLYILHDISC